MARCIVQQHDRSNEVELQWAAAVGYHSVVCVPTSFGIFANQKPHHSEIQTQTVPTFWGELHIDDVRNTLELVVAKLRRDESQGTDSMAVAKRK